MARRFTHFPPIRRRVASASISFLSKKFSIINVKKLKAIDPFYSGPRKLLVDKLVFFAQSLELLLSLLENWSMPKAPKKGEKTDTNVSHRFQQFLDHKQNAADLSKEKKKKKNKNKFKPTTEEDEEYPQLQRQGNESDRTYLQRLDQEAKFALDRARYESKYDVKLVDSHKGDHQIEIKKEKSQRSEKRLK